MRHLLLAAALLSAFTWPADARTRGARATGHAATASDAAAPASTRATRTRSAAATPAASGTCTQASPCTGPRGGRYYMSGTRKVYLPR